MSFREILVFVAISCLYWCSCDRAPDLAFNNPRDSKSPEYIPTATVNFSSVTDLSRFVLSSSTGTYNIVGGQLRITGTSDQYIAQAELKNYYVANGLIEAKTRWISGNTGASYGIAFRSQSANSDGYGFSISANGYYKINKWIANSWQDIVGWTSSSYIVKNGINILKAECQGTYITLYINDHFVRKINDASFISGSVGMFAGANGMTIDFDDLTITPLP